MSNKWIDLPGLPHIAAAVLLTWEIEFSAQGSLWTVWNGKLWDSDWKYRGRPKQPKTHEILRECWSHPEGFLTWRKPGELQGLSPEKWERLPAGDITEELKSCS